MSREHSERIKKELIAAGITLYGLSKLSINELPNIIHDNEHIGGIVYGQIGGGNSALLVATDHRIIYIDRRAIFSTIDELTYDVVSGVKSNSAGPFTSLVLHTKVNDYSLRYVNAKCARIFISYIEKMRLEKGSYDQATGRHTADQEARVLHQPNDNAAEDNETALNFLKSNDMAVLSTIDRTGNVHGALVYYLSDQDNNIYVLTKSGTGKGRNVYAHSQVALTIHKEGTLQTLQLEGIADIETDQTVKDEVLQKIVKPRRFQGESHMPPVTKLHVGAYMVIRITPTVLKYRDYAKDS